MTKLLGPILYNSYSSDSDSSDSSDDDSDSSDDIVKNCATIRDSNKTIVGNFNTIYGNNNTVIGNGCEFRGHHNTGTGNDSVLYGHHNEGNGNNIRIYGHHNNAHGIGNTIKGGHHNGLSGIHRPFTKSGTLGYQDNNSGNSRSRRKRKHQGFPLTSGSSNMTFINHGSVTVMIASGPINVPPEATEIRFEGDKLTWKMGRAKSTIYDTSRVTNINNIPIDIYKESLGFNTQPAAKKRKISPKPIDPFESIKEAKAKDLEDVKCVACMEKQKKSDDECKDCIEAQSKSDHKNQCPVLCFSTHLR